jgi:hypothetical protein
MKEALAAGPSVDWMLALEVVVSRNDELTFLENVVGIR